MALTSKYEQMKVRIRRRAMKLRMWAFCLTTATKDVSGGVSSAAKHSNNQLPPSSCTNIPQPLHADTYLLCQDLRKSDLGGKASPWMQNVQGLGDALARLRHDAPFLPCPRCSLP
eukprot:2673713-Rhodomonas_salina.3